MSNKQKIINFGCVVFYEPNYNDKTIKEIGRTNIVNYQAALHCYCETPNPASQIVSGESIADVQIELLKLEQLITKRKWLNALFDSI